MNWSYLASLAWRDTRRNRGRLLLFMSSIVLGIAALVAINSFNYNLQNDIDEQAATLLGADLSVDGNRAANDTIQALLQELPGESAQKKEVLSMSYFPRIDHSQFIRLQGLQGGFPFYGKLNTEPKEAYLQIGQRANMAVVDQGLMRQYQIELGDSIRLGTKMFVIGGELKNDFASANIAAGFAPSVYIALDDMFSTGLIQPGSLVNHYYYQKLPKDFAADEWAKANREDFRNNSLGIQTIQGQKEQLSDAFSGLNDFLNLVALVSLLLGCIGVASSVLIYVRTKIPSIAIFRCLGMQGKQVFYVYLLQIMSLGVLSVGIGVILGTVVQLFLPVLFRDFLPLEVTTEIAWSAVGEGWLIGLTVTLLFALVPLLPIRRISPLRILRSSYQDDVAKVDGLQMLVYGGIVISLFLFLWHLTGTLRGGLTFTVGLLAAFGVLFGVAKGIVWLIQRYFPRSWNFVFRQGLANLYRPNNQTATLIVSIGLGTAILTMLFIIQGLLLQNVAEMDAGNQPNVILYGIEKDQLPALEAMTISKGMPVIQQVPIVTMRMTGWKGRTKAEWLSDTTRKAESWAFNREIRTTFRDTVDEFEEILEGTFPRPRPTKSDTIFISLGESFAEAMDVGLGDDITFNVQGMSLTTYVGSIRSVDFTKMRTRFFVLFPNNVLENAPQFNVLVTKSANPDMTTQYRTEVVRDFPNVSVVDLSSILSALNDILNKVSYVIQFMAIFSMLTGLIVLISSLLLSKLQRIRESVLLRTLGASSRQLLRINLTEYALLGIIAAATGIAIAIVGSWALTTYQLELDYYLPGTSILAVFVFIVGLVMFIGWLNSREVLRKSPLEVLRKEV